ncbi:MAG: tyrosine-type recombinase/integrase, partial [Acidimicrobiales bacterium]
QLSRTVRFDKRRGTKSDAEEALRAFAEEVRAGEVIGTTATVGKLLDAWLANLDRLGKARSTLETYGIHVEKHIRPGLGAIRLDKLTVHDVDRYLGDLDAAKGLAPRTIKTDHAILSAALTQAVDWGWIKANPAKRARLKSAKAAAVPPLTTEQLGTLCQAALADDEDMAVVIALAAITGCRRGELAGLQWEDFDTEARTLRVCRQWVPGKGGQHLTDETKTGKARTVHIGTAGVALLERYKATLTDRVGHEPDGWILSYNGGTTPMRAKSLTEYVSKLAKRVKVPAHLHTLRHWASTEMVAQGVDLPTAAARSGHSVGVMAETYLHASDERAAAAGELLAGVVAGAIDVAELGKALEAK